MYFKNEAGHYVRTVIQQSPQFCLFHLALMVLDVNCNRVGQVRATIRHGHKDGHAYFRLFLNECKFSLSLVIYCEHILKGKEILV